MAPLLKSRKSSRAQLNFEYLILTGILLAILIPLIYTSLSTVHQSYKATRINDILSQVTQKANDIYQLGPGNKDEITLVMPSGITGAVVSGNEISLTTHFGNENTTTRKYSEPTLIGSLETIQGEYVVPIKSLNESLVRIGTGPWIVDLDPSCIGAPNFADPPNITIHGDDFFSTSLLLKDGAPFNTAYYHIVDLATIVFIASPTEFSAQPGGNPYAFSVQDGTKISNSLDFWVYPSPNQCP